MFKSSAIFLTLTAALELVLASSVSITTPEPKDTWEIGSTVQIKWDVNEVTNSTIRLLYASGPPQSLTVNGLIADNVDPSLGTYSWKIPSSIKAKKYVIEAGPNNRDLSFAGYITIKKPTKKPTKKTTKKTTQKSTKKTAKKSTKKTTQKPTKKSTKKTTKKTSKKTTVKKSTTKKAKKTNTKKPSAICVGYPTRDDKIEGSVRCHSIPKAGGQAKKSAKKSKKDKKHTKKSTKKTAKKTTKKTNHKSKKTKSVTAGSE